MDQPAKRMDALDGLRGIAALAIVVLHVWMFHYGDAGRPPKGLGDLVIGEFRLGVPLFFVLSGFLLYRPWVGAALDGRRRPHLARYARARIARLLPAYWAALLGAWVVLDHAGHPLLVAAARLPVFLVFGQNYFADTAERMDPPMWTLCVEVSFYALLPLVGLAATALGPRRRRQVALAAAFTALGCATAWWAAFHGPAEVNASLLVYAPHFGAGMFAAAVLHRRPLGRGAGLLLLAAGVALVAGDGWWHSTQFGSRDLRFAVGDLPAAAGFALVVAALAASPVRARALTGTAARRLGELSYGVYLWHFIMIILLRSNDLWPDALGPAILRTLVLTLLAATVSWTCLERPVIRRVRGAARRRPQTRGLQPQASTSSA